MPELPRATLGKVRKTALRDYVANPEERAALVASWVAAPTDEEVLGVSHRLNGPEA